MYEQTCKLVSGYKYKKKKPVRLTTKIAKKKRNEPMLFFSDYKINGQQI